MRDGVTEVSFVVEAGEAARSVEDGEAAVGIVVDPHGDADVVLAVALRGNLKAAGGGTSCRAGNSRRTRPNATLIIVRSARNHMCPGPK